MNLGLGLNLSAGGGSPPQPPELPGELLCNAIAAKVCVTATIKGKAYKLAPYVVYTGGKAGVLLVDAVTIERDGKPSNKAKIEPFDVADLLGLTRTADAFTPLAGFDPAEYAGQAICIIQIV